MVKWPKKGRRSNLKVPVRSLASGSTFRHQDLVSSPLVTHFIEILRMLMAIFRYLARVKYDFGNDHFQSLDLSGVIISNFLDGFYDPGSL